MNNVLTLVCMNLSAMVICVMFTFGMLDSNNVRQWTVSKSWSSKLCSSKFWSIATFVPDY